jgi:anti-sigma factor RsiW
VNCEELRNLQPLYVDGDLPAPVMATVDAHLQNCADCRRLVDGDRALKSAIQQTASRYAAPPLLTARLRRETQAPPPSRVHSLRYLGTGWNPVAIAASLLLAIASSVSITGSYVAPDREEQVVGQVVASHVRSLMGEHLTDVAFTSPSSVRPFFDGKVEATPPAVDVSRSGYALVGGRLDYVADHRCAALVYRNDKHVINLEVWTRGADDRDVTEAYAQQGYNLVHVTAGNLDYWAISDLSRNELSDFVRDFVTTAETAGEKI